jgi:hypothetical protein
VDKETGEKVEVAVPDEPTVCERNDANYTALAFSVYCAKTSHGAFALQIPDLHLTVRVTAMGVDVVSAEHLLARNPVDLGSLMEAHCCAMGERKATYPVIRYPGSL